MGILKTMPQPSACLLHYLCISINQNIFLNLQGQFWADGRVDGVVAVRLSLGNFISWEQLELLESLTSPLCWQYKLAVRSDLSSDCVMTRESLVCLYNKT